MLGKTVLMLPDPTENFKKDPKFYINFLNNFILASMFKFAFIKCFNLNVLNTGFSIFVSL